MLNQNKVRALAALTLLANSLVGCGDEKNAFDRATSHIWGDKYNGCDYQTVSFAPDKVVMQNSQRRINEIAAISKGSTGKAIALPQKQTLTFVSLKQNANSLTIFDEQNLPLAKFHVVDDDLTIEAIQSRGVLRAVPKRKGIGNQSDFIVCG